MERDLGVPIDKPEALKIRRLSVLVAVIVALALVTTGFLRKGGAQQFLSYGGALAMHDSALSLWNQGTLAAESFRKLHDDIIARSVACGCRHWQDIYGLGADKLLYPARAVILSVIASPFAGLAGELGLWLLNSILFVGVVCAFFILCAAHSTGRAALCATFLFISGTGLIGYDFGLHYDLWALFLLLLALVLVSRYPVVAGFLLALMIEIRPTHLLFLPLLLCAFRSEAGVLIPKRSMRAGVGVTLGLLVVGVMNWILWGHPWITGFQRMVNYDAGAIVFKPSHPLLDPHELISSWIVKLFDPAIGIISSNPVVVLGIFGFTLCQSWPRRWKFGVMLVSMLQLLIFASDQSWASNGNLLRYIFPSVALLSLGIAPFFDLVLFRSGVRAGQRSLDPSSPKEPQGR